MACCNHKTDFNAFYKVLPDISEENFIIRKHETRHEDDDDDDDGHQLCETGSLTRWFNTQEEGLHRSGRDVDRGKK